MGWYPTGCLARAELGHRELQLAHAPAPEGKLRLELVAIRRGPEVRRPGSLPPGCVCGVANQSGFTWVTVQGRAGFIANYDLTK